MGAVGLGSVTWNGAINRSARVNFFPRRSIAHLEVNRWPGRRPVGALLGMGYNFDQFV